MPLISSSLDQLPSRLLRLLIVLGVTLLAAWLWLPRDEQGGEPIPEVPAVLHGGDALVPLAPAPSLPAAKVALGRQLYFDARLSHDNTVSCASCHDLGEGGNDGRQYSIGVDGQRGSVNAPTVFNAANNFVQFWDGRAASLEEQAAGPVHNPVEMASNWDEVIAKLEADKPFVKQFADVYPNGITPANIVDAIATFERTLITADAPFDRYLRGNARAISEAAKIGYRTFRDLGCASCHQGVNVGGNMYQRFGVMADYFADRSKRMPVGTADYGRYNVTQKEEDRYVFKVPSLRNVALTAPYFHDGTVRTLDEAVSIMGRYQLGRELSKDEIASLVAFLRTLTGVRPANLLQ